MNIRILSGGALSCLCLFLAGAGTLWAGDGPWASKADMPTPRDSFAAAVVNGWIYTFGGRVEPNEGLQTVEAYDPATDQWVKKTDMPTARRGASAVVVDGKIYVMGGFLGSADLKALAAVEVYDPATDTWTKRADMLKPRGFTAAELVDGKIYVIAGYSSGTTQSSVQEYDPAADQWTEKTRMPVANSHLASGLVGERIYVVGGIDFPSAFLVYDPAADTWERQEDLPIGRILPGVGVVDGMLYVMGGVQAESSKTPLAIVGQYDPSTGIWSERAAMPTARAGLSAIAVAEKIYALGGATGNVPWQVPKQVLGTVEEYTPAEDRTRATVFGPAEGPPSTTVPAPGFFAEVTQEAVRAPLIDARSTAFGDYDNDGWPDIFIVENFGPKVALYHNEGHGRFTDQTTAIQDPLTPQWKGGGSIFGDFDNDGDLDLFVPVGMFYSARSEQNLLLRNDRGVFRDVTLEAGLTDRLPTDNALWLDYDRDGFLDIYTGNLGCAPAVPGMRNALYRNQGDGTFADVTGETGLDIEIAELGGCGGGSNGGMAAGDFDNDGWPDLYVGNHNGPNYLFLNDGKGGFQDATTKEIGDPGEAYGVAVGDIDNDGDLEIFQAAGGAAGLQRSLMLLNLGQGQFLDVTEGVGLAGLSGQNYLGAGLADIDNDGDLDLLVAEPHFLYLNQGDGTFVDQTSYSGVHAVSNALSFGDYDLDGFLDVLWGGVTSFGGLFRNSGNTNHSLQVELVGIKSNRSGVGARLFATSGELRQMREMLGGLGYYQDELVAHFGLGQRTKVDRLEVRWPSGQVDVLTDIPADQKIRVFEGRGAWQAVEPTRWEVAPPDSIEVGTPVDLTATVRPALFEPSAEVTRVTANLSSFGGPAEIPLVALGDGTYRLETTPLAAVRTPGLREVSVLVEQATSLGPYWTKLSKSIAIAKSVAGDLLILGDALFEGWRVEDSGGVEGPTLTGAGPVYLGQLAGAIHSRPEGWSVKFLPAVPVDTLQYKGLRFAFHPGGVTATPRSTFAVVINSSWAVGLVGGSTGDWGIDPGLKSWQVVEIPLSIFNLKGPIKSIRFAGNLEGTFYLDDLRLLTSRPSPQITAVLEDRTSSLPQSFALSQNFPNPFNSDTVIRFALPDNGEVELAVYNLAGQQVAKLAEGVREAGTYTLRWDGRDGRGRELASGIYLYRLRAGVKVETRKLVLLR